MEEINVVDLDLELQIEGKLFLTQLEERYNCSRSTLTNRMNKLRLATLQERKGAAGYLDAPGVEMLDQLYNYLQEHGSDAGFPYPEEVAIAPAAKANFTHTTQSHISEAPQQIEASELIQPQAPGAAGYAAINPERMMAEALVRAQENLMAAETARNLVNNPHLLPLDVQRQITQYTAELTRKMPQPKSPDPMELAEQILDKVRAYGLNP